MPCISEVSCNIQTANIVNMEHDNLEVRTSFSCAIQDVPLLVADVSDQPAISRVASQTKVVLALNGPYALMGTPVIEACLQEGTHYCDITGACKAKDEWLT